jgi:hypothetical protein
MDPAQIPQRRTAVRICEAGNIRLAVMGVMFPLTFDPNWVNLRSNVD